MGNPQVTMGFNTTIYYKGLTTWMIWGATILGNLHIGRWSLIPLIRIYMYRMDEQKPSKIIKIKGPDNPTCQALYVCKILM
jgi:hypothetical protein